MHPLSLDVSRPSASLNRYSPLQPSAPPASSLPSTSPDFDARRVLSRYCTHVKYSNCEGEASFCWTYLQDVFIIPIIKHIEWLLTYSVLPYLFIYLFIISILLLLLANYNYTLHLYN